MRSPLEVITSLGASTTSALHAIHFLTRERDPFTKKRYEELVAEIIGGETAPTFLNLKEAALYFHYVVQETVAAFQSDVPDMDEVWKTAAERANTHIGKNPWCVKDYESENTTDEDGNTRPKKGDRKRQTEEIYLLMNNGKSTRTDIIKAFIDEAEMTKPGATTYFHNLKKEHGFAGPKTVRKKAAPKADKPAEKTKKATKKPRKGPSKGARAKEIYVEMIAANPDVAKVDIITRIVAETGTSKAGANTYYCAARKG